jgi:hypothetical protein
VRNSLQKRIDRLEASNMPLHHGALHPPFLSRDELSVAIVLTIRQKLSNFKGDYCGRRSRRTTDRHPPERQKKSMIINWANERVKAIQAAGLVKPIVSRLQAKGYAFTK